jgi:hypothetical protein
MLAGLLIVTTGWAPALAPGRPLLRSPPPLALDASSTGDLLLPGMLAAGALVFSAVNQKKADDAGKISCYIADGVETDGKPSYICTAQPDEVGWFMGTKLVPTDRTTTSLQCEIEEAFNGEPEFTCTEGDAGQ